MGKLKENLLVIYCFVFILANKLMTNFFLELTLDVLRTLTKSCLANTRQEYLQPADIRHKIF